MNEAYRELLAKRQDHNRGSGFDPVWMPDFLFDFQRALVEWSLQRGRSAIFADCGLGKTPMQLVWAENVVRKTDGRVLVLTPLAVSYQTQREGEKFGIECEVSREGNYSSRIVITNYERLKYFDPSDFAGVVCDESSAIKNFAGKRRKEITECMKKSRYRLLCTATPSPNDFHEMGTSSEALGYLGYMDMITKFFKQDQVKEYLGWARSKYRFRGHAEEPFWRWVCSWARACRKPSDLGDFDDDQFHLPPLREHEALVENTTPIGGRLFSVPASTLQEQREERRATLRERCEVVANIVQDRRPSVAWCHLNTEGDILEKMIPDAVQVKGSMPDDRKEDVLRLFSEGEIPVLVTKPKIGCWGLNWQHCSNVVTFPSHSFEQYYQLVRRCWRFGQENPVDVHVVTTEGEQRVMANLREKSERASKVFDEVVSGMQNGMHAESLSFHEREEIPSWL